MIYWCVHVDSYSGEVQWFVVDLWMSDADSSAASRTFSFQYQR